MTQNLKYRSKTAFTLIELLVVVAIIALLIAILLPSLASARNQAKAVTCTANQRSMGLATQVYLNNYKEHFPTRSATSATGGGSVFGAAEPLRIILTQDRRPLGILTCPTDADPIRDYPVGDDLSVTGTPNPDGLGIGTAYRLPPSTLVRYSYGLNNMTGINPTTPAERLLFNPNATAYKWTDKTLLYADSAWINARGHDKVINDEPGLKGRVANAGADSPMNTLAVIKANVPDLTVPQEEFKRHPTGNNVLFMDHHAEPVSQPALFAPATVLYSWSEQWQP